MKRSREEEDPDQSNPIVKKPKAIKENIEEKSNTNTDVKEQVVNNDTVEVQTNESPVAPTLNTPPMSDTAEDVNVFSDFDLTTFWDNNEISVSGYVSDPYTQEDVTEVEETLGFKLPRSYLDLMALQNGGTPVNNAHPSAATSWAKSHICITGIMGIGSDRVYSLLGEMGSAFMIEEWEYPNIGIYFSDCPSAGHDMVCMDYTKCGTQGEPEIVHVDQESDFKIVFLAKDFETFIRGLVNADTFEEDE